MRNDREVEWKTAQLENGVQRDPRMVRAREKSSDVRRRMVLNGARGGKFHSRERTGLFRKWTGSGSVDVKLTGWCWWAERWVR
jgi:hypothetical protein